MGKLSLIALILLNTTILLAQSSNSDEDKKWRQEMTQRNGFPEPPKTPTSPWLYRKSDVGDLTKSYPDMLPPHRKPGLTKEEIEEIRKSEEALNILRAPRAEDVTKYKEFLKQKRTGLFRLFPDLGCDGKYSVNIAGVCSNAVSSSWSYSFLRRYYGDSYFYDLRLKDERLIADGFLSQSIIVPLGDFALDTVSLKTNGMKFLTDFKPERKNKKAREQFGQISAKITSDGFVYGKVVHLNENVIYGMRIAAYKLDNKNKTEPYQVGKIESEQELRFIQLDYDKRRDKIIAFSIVRKDTDGSITILWKELSDNKAPILTFDKGEKLQDLKEK